MTARDLAYRGLNDAVRRIHNRTSVPVPSDAPLPSDGGETVGDYNAKHPGKAWRIVAMTWNGEACCADCAYDWPTFEADYDWADCPMPVFASDELYGDHCDGCGAAIA